MGIGLPAPRRHVPRCGGHAARARWPRSRADVQAKILGANAAELYGLPRASSTSARRRDGMFGDVIREAAARYGDTPLYVTPDGSEPLLRRARPVCPTRSATGLAARGVRVGDVVALLLPSGPAYAVAYAAAAKIGAVTAGVNDRLSPPERRRCLAVARPRLVVASKELARDTAIDEVAEVRRRSSRSTPIRPAPTLHSMLGELRAGPGTANAHPELVPPHPTPIAPWPWCSRRGRRGSPRGRCSRGASSRPSATSTAAADGAAAGRGLSSTSFAHLGYMTKLPQALRGGGTTFIMGRWSAGDALEMVRAPRHHRARAASPPRWRSCCVTSASTPPTRAACA